MRAGCTHQAAFVVPHPESSGKNIEEGSEEQWFFQHCLHRYYILLVQLV